MCVVSMCAMMCVMTLGNDFGIEFDDNCGNYYFDNCLGNKSGNDVADNVINNWCNDWGSLVCADFGNGVVSDLGYDSNSMCVYEFGNEFGNNLWYRCG